MPWKGWCLAKKMRLVERERETHVVMVVVANVVMGSMVMTATEGGDREREASMEGEGWALVKVKRRRSRRANKEEWKDES